MENTRSTYSLFRQDSTIVFNEIRSSFPSWADRLLAVLGLSIALATVHSVLAYRPFMLAAWIVAVLAAVIGAGMSRLIQRRLEFHAYDGVLAAAALDPAARIQYWAAFQGIAVISLGIAILVARPSILPFLLPGYLAGIAISGLMRRITTRAATHRRASAIGRTIRVGMRRPTAGIFAAVSVLVILMAARDWDPAPRSVLAGIVTAVAVQCLLSLDDAVIRFMTISGYRAWSIAGLQSRGALIFLAITAPTCLIASDPLVAGMACAVVAGGIVLMTARIFAYRVHAKRTADMIVGTYFGAVCTAGFAIPPLLPFIVAAMIWHLHRRSSARTWLLT